MKTHFLSFVFFSLIFASSLIAECPAVVKFADVGWTDISSTTAVIRELLAKSGIKSKAINLSVPVTFASLKNNNVDIFLGNWMPTMAEDIKPYLADGSVEVVGPILEGAKYTLAVPSYVYDAGVRDFKDLAKFQDKFSSKIFGIESGNDGNRLIEKMIKNKDYGLGSWKLVESSEQAMVLEVMREVKKQEWVVFLAWQPHPMNKKIDLKYLSGGEDFFGKSQGDAKVYVNLRKNFSKECPQVVKILKNIKFTVDQENDLMDLILTHGKSEDDAAKDWLTKNQKITAEWLKI